MNDLIPFRVLSAGWFALTFALIAQSAFVSSVYAQSDTLTISARGIGTSEADAKKDAFTNALQQAVGAFIDSETIIENDEIIKDKLLAVSDGFVKSYDVTTGPTKRRDGLTEIAIKAVIQKGKVVARLKEVRVMKGDVAGKDAAAEVITKIANFEQGQELLVKYFSKLPEQLLVARLVDANGKPAEQIRPITKIQPDRRISCQWNIEIYFDLAAYYEQAFPQLDKVLTAIAINPPQTAIAKGERHGSQSVALTEYPLLHDITWQGFYAPSTRGSTETPLFLHLSMGRDKYGENERFRIYEIDRGFYEKTIDELASRFGKIQLHFYALNSSGGVIREEVISLEKLYTVYGSKYQEVSCNPELLTQEDSRGNQRLLSPRFAAKNSYDWKCDRDRGYTDTLLVPFKTMIEQDDLEQIAQVRFRFAP